MGPKIDWISVASNPVLCQRLSPKNQAVHDFEAKTRDSEYGLKITIAG